MTQRLICVLYAQGAGRFGIGRIAGMRRCPCRFVSWRVETTGIEPATSWLQTRERPVVTVINKEVTSTSSACCTPCCTENAVQATHARLVALVASLSHEERRRLADLLERAEQAPSDEAAPYG